MKSDRLVAKVALGFARCPQGRGAIWTVVLLGATACGGRQSVLNATGQQARQIEHLWWQFLAVLLTVYLLVMIGMLIAVSRKRRDHGRSIVGDEPEPRRERRMGIAVSSFVAITVIILFFFLVSDFATGRALHTLSDPDPVRIKIIGHQWWWEVIYQDPTPSQMVTTANEVHVPVGKAVQFELSSSDVIHSFWAPNFHGKKDLVPGHPTQLGFGPSTRAASEVNARSSAACSMPTCAL